MAKIKIGGELYNVADMSGCLETKNRSLECALSARVPTGTGQSINSDGATR